MILMIHLKCMDMFLPDSRHKGIFLQQNKIKSLEGDITIVLRV